MKNSFLRKRLNSAKRFQTDQYSTFISLLPDRGEKSLEVGCGKGFFSYLVGLSGIKQIYGCDVYSDMQKEEIANVATTVNYRGVKSDNLIPYADNVFDLVFSMDVIEHVEKDYQFIKEHIRTCKRSGTIIIGTPNLYRLANLPLLALGLLRYPRIMGKDTYGECMHLREYRKIDLIALLNHFADQIEVGSLEIVPSWFGVMALNVGMSIEKTSIISNLCQFWFIKFKKK